MWNFHEGNSLAELVYFFTKKGDKTRSPYEAQLWKWNSISVYARLKNMKGEEFDTLVKQIHFKHNRNPAIIVSFEKGKKKYELINLICGTRVLYYDELYFFCDNDSFSISTETAWHLTFAVPDEPGCRDAIELMKSQKKNVSILYVSDSTYGGTTTGIIRNVQNYDESSRMVITNNCQKIFLANKT